MHPEFLKKTKGFSLTELIVVMGIFLVVMMVTANAFTVIMTKSGQQAKSVETQIEGIVGLELIRSDLQQAGFGLPWSYQSGIKYTECTTPNVSTFEDITPLNDGPAGRPPRALFGINGSASRGLNGSDYFTVKATVVGMNSTAKKWSYQTFLKYSASSAYSKGTLWNGNPSNSELNLANGDRVIVVRTSVSSDNSIRKELVLSGGAFFTIAAVNGGTLTVPQGFRPQSATETFLMYGVDDKPDTPFDLTMPFNRADYFIDIPDRANVICATNTGTLYRATVNQKGGRLNRQPILDCVADMQLVYSLDTNGDGLVDLHDNADLAVLGPVTEDTASLIRAEVKEVRLYILAQEGKKDRFFNFPSDTVPVGEELNGIFYGTEKFDLKGKIGADWNHYRWKVYTIVAKPGNLN